MIWETCIEYGRDLTFALGAGFRRARHRKSNQSASCMAAKALADVDVHDTDRIQTRSGAADAGSDEALHRQELVGRAAKWVAVSDDVQATLPVDLPEKYRQRSPDSCKVAWLCCPSVPELNGIYRHSDLATNCGHCLKCGRFIDWGGTVGNALRHARGFLHGQNARLQRCDDPDTPQGRLADGLTMVASGMLTYEDTQNPEWKRLSGFARRPEQAPGRRRVTQMIHECRLSLEEEIAALIHANPQYIVLQIDCWKHPDIHSRYVGFFEAVVGPNGENTRALIRLEPFTWEKEDGESLAKVIREVIAWTGRVPDVILRDTASNISKAVRLVAESYMSEKGIITLPCFAHMLNLVLKKFLQALDGFVKNVKDLREFLFGRSGVFSAWLRANGYDRLSVPAMTDVRWTSFDRMAEGLLAFESAIPPFLQAHPEMGSAFDELVPDPVALFADLRTVQQIVRDSFTTRMLMYQARSDGQLCTVYPSLAKLRRELSSVPLGLASASKAALSKLTELEEKHKPLLTPHIEVAARLFPWTAAQVPSFMSREDVRVADAEVMRRMSRFDDEASTSVRVGHAGCADPEDFMRRKCSSPTRQAPSSVKSVTWTVAQEYGNWKEGPLDLPNWGCMQGDDLTRYLAEAAKKWPRLTRVMRAVFATPASSAWLESSFSIATWLADPRRTRLTPEHMADLTVLTCNKQMAARHIRRIAANYLSGQAGIHGATNV